MNPVSTTHLLSEKQRIQMVLHSFIIITLGFMGGIGWLVVLGGHLELWPLPLIEMNLLDKKELWRNAHTGPITNGIFIMALAAISPLLRLKPQAAKTLCYATIVMLWTNTIGYQTSPYTTNRGLDASGGFLNHFCYFSFYTAVFAALIVVGLGIYGCFGALKAKST
ncbi:MAG: hypothetical protein AAFU64_04225 [Bacteroidota bacterium]